MSIAVPLAERAIDKLQDSSANVRLEGLDDLAKLGDPRTIPIVASLLAGDDKVRVRGRAARVLAQMAHAHAVPYLGATLGRESEAEIRAVAARALGTIGREEAIPYLAEAAKGDSSKSVRLAASSALRRIGGPQAVAPLCGAMAGTADERFKVYVISVLCEIGYPDAASTLRARLERDESPKVRLASVTALKALLGTVAVPDLCNALTDDEDKQVRERAARLLGDLADDSSMDCLCKSVVSEPNVTVRNASVAALARVGSWQARADQMLAEVDSSGVWVEEIDVDVVATVITPAGVVSREGEQMLQAYLAEQAIGKDGRMMEILSELKIAIFGDSPEPALAPVSEPWPRAPVSEPWPRAPVSEPQPQQALPQEAPRQPREYASAEATLDPTVRVLREDLRTHFQQPISELTAVTGKQWRKTVVFAQVGMATRMVMSVAVFIAGLVLTGTAARRFFSEGQAAASVAGAILVFLVGVAMMLLIIYTGPIKEIRQSAIQLGSATAAFMGYVHRLLEISHTFSSLYLAQKLSFDDMERSSVLIQTAMNDTMGILKAGAVEQTSGTIRQTMGHLGALRRSSPAAGAPPPGSAGPGAGS